MRLSSRSNASKGARIGGRLPARAQKTPRLLHPSAHNIDLTHTSYDRNPPISAFDITISCPLLPAYLAKVAEPTHIIALSASEKLQKHLSSSSSAAPSIPSSSPPWGIGPRSFLSFVHRVFRHAASSDILAGGRGHLTSYRRMLFFASVHAALARVTDAMTRDRLIHQPSSN
jgi:hypothetical protein